MTSNVRTKKATGGTPVPPGQSGIGHSTKSLWTSYGMLVFGAILLMIPFAWLVLGSLKTDQEISNLSQILPEQAQWGNFIQSLEFMGLEVPWWLQFDYWVLSDWLPSIQESTPLYNIVQGDIQSIKQGAVNFPRFPALANTIVVTVCVVILQLLSSALVGYGFARYRFRGSGPIFMIMLATMMLPYQVTMIPVFLLFRSIGWVDTLLPLIVPFAFGNPFFIFMYRQFFMQIPQDLHDAAKIDGASAWRTFWKIMFPLTTPVAAIVAIYSFMFTWNDFLAPLIYLNSPSMRTLAVELNAFNGQYGVESRNLLLAASFITMLPCVLLFFAAQKYFVESSASSGLKG